MRLICPNCDAQYEVPVDVIPEEGREVQCSNCGQTWFQEHPDHRVAGNDETADPTEDTEVVAMPTTAGPRNEPRETLAPVEKSDEAPASEEPATGRRELDPAIADVLRAEAELEAQARRNESAVFESQPDLGLTETPDDGKRRALEAQERMARMRAEMEEADEIELDLPPAASQQGSRRDLLPDIEEINSTLRSNNDRSPTTDPGQTAQVEAHEKRSTRRGFSLTVLLVAGLALVYVFAPQIIDAMPDAEPALTSYVQMVDSWRGWLDTTAASVLSWLDAAAASSAE